MREELLKYIEMVFGHLYCKYIFLRTSKPKIKLQKGVQYGTFKVRVMSILNVCSEFLTTEKIVNHPAKFEGLKKTPSIGIK